MRATFSRFNIAAEVHRQLQGVRFATPDERIAVAEPATGLALGEALLIDPPVLHHTPEKVLRPDGTSKFRPSGRQSYTTVAILEAEARLLDAGRRLDAPSVNAEVVAAVLDLPAYGRPEGLSADQSVAVERIAASGRFVDLLVGPAGTGKSAGMGALRAVWEAQYGPGSVIGLAPSAAAAEVLAEGLGIETENTAKWLFEHRRQPARQAKLEELRQLLAADTFSPAGQATIRRHLDAVQADLERWRLAQGQLVIIDEASLAGTFALDELVCAAGDVGAKIVLVGDPFQLDAVEAGGMLATLLADRDGHVAELTGVHRFAEQWEKRPASPYESATPPPSTLTRATPGSPEVAATSSSTPCSPRGGPTQRRVGPA